MGGAIEHPPMSTVRMPAVFEHYACQRSMICCGEPVRAPCEDDERDRIRPVLASTAQGRGYLPIFEASTEVFLNTKVFKHDDGHCQHLRFEGKKGATESGCSLHFIGGVDALSTACRNYPRWVTRLAVEPGSQAEMEAMFLLACPTAAGLLVRDPRPFSFVEVPVATWIYTPTREASIEATARAQMLREGWWRVLANGRGDPERLLAVLDAMLKVPLVAPEGEPERSAEITPSLLHGIGIVEAGHMLGVLEQMPDRGATYAAHHWDVRHDISLDVERAALVEMLAIAPELLSAYLDHSVPFAGLHDERPTHHWMKTTVRRAVAIARLADALLARVPFGIDILFADLFVCTMQLDAMLTRPDA